MLAFLAWSARRLAPVLTIVTLLAGLAAIASETHAGWLNRIAGTAEHAGTRTAKFGSRALDNVAAHVKTLPDRADGAAVFAAQATQEGHWRFVNKAGETFTAGTPDELKRVVSVLLPEAKADTKLALYVTQETVFQHRAALKDLPKGSELHVVIGGESYRILKRMDAGAERLFAELRPSLLIELVDRAQFDEVLWQLMRPLDRASVRVLALEPGGPSTLSSVPRLDAATKRAVVDIIDPSSLAAAMGTIRGQTVVVTGRVDGQLFYVKPSSGPERSLLVRDLLQAVEDADVNLLMLQSSSTPRQPGGRNWFWQKVEVKGLDDALQRARVADFLNALAGPKRFAVTTTPAGSRTLRTRIDLRTAPDLPGTPLIKPVGDIFSGLVADVAGHVVTTSVQLDLRNAERQQELDQRILPGIPSELQFVYLAMMLIGLLGLPVSRGWWRRIWPPEQADDYAGRSGYLAAKAVRGAIYIFAFLPLTALAALPVHVILGTWHLVTSPLRWWRWLTSWRVRPQASGIEA